MRKEIQDLLAKKDFSEGLLKLDDPSKVKDYFETNGNLKDVTDDEVKEIGLDLGNLMQNIAKLPEDKLGKIGGGVGDDEVDDFMNELLPEPIYQDSSRDARIARGERGPLGNKDNNMSTGKKVGIGVAALGGLAAAGAGVYKIGKTKGWWSKLKRK